MLTKSSAINFHRNPPSLLVVRTPSFYSGHYNILPASCISINKTSTITSCSRWDSNAETIGSRKFQDRDSEDSGNEYVEREEGDSTRKGKKRRWWSDEPKYMEEEVEEEKGGILEEAIDSLWILKVFKSYGWTLPPIIISWLLSSGPKAFLTVFSISLGLSMLTFAVEKLLGRAKSKSKLKPKKRRKPYGSSRSEPEMDNKEEGNQENVKGKMGYESWVANDNGSVRKGSRQDEPQFGGWEELDEMETVQRPRPVTGRARRTTLANGKFSKGGRKGDTPLLLRLLIAVFPFLGSWTKML